MSPTKSVSCCDAGSTALPPKDATSKSVDCCEEGSTALQHHPDCPLGQAQEALRRGPTDKYVPCCAGTVATGHEERCPAQPVPLQRLRDLVSSTLLQDVRPLWARDGLADLIAYIDQAKIEAQKLGRVTGEPLAQFLKRLKDEHTQEWLNLLNSPPEVDTLREAIDTLREALDGVRPESCTCSEDQLSVCCGCGFELARAAYEETKPEPPDAD